MFILWPPIYLNCKADEMIYWLLTVVTNNLLQMQSTELNLYWMKHVDDKSEFTNLYNPVII